MNLNRNKWYVQWFFWSLGIYDEFTEQWKTHDVDTRGTNLCFFMRVTLVWAPLILLLHVLVLGLVIVTLTAVPVWAFGISYYLGALLAVALTVGMILGVKAWLNFRRQKKQERKAVTYEGLAGDSDGEIVRKKVPATTSTSPGFGKVLWAYIIAAKKKICPSITFTGQEVQV